MSRLVVVTGTNTDVGKTVATAALAATAIAAGERTVVVKPVQTGIATGDPGDAPVVAALTGCATRSSPGSRSRSRPTPPLAAPASRSRRSPTTSRRSSRSSRSSTR